MKQHAYHDGYANLAAAIIANGQKHNDQAFLESEWCDLLRGLCQLDDELHNRGPSIIMRGGAAHGAQIDPN